MTASALKNKNHVMWCGASCQILSELAKFFSHQVTDSGFPLFPSKQLLNSGYMTDCALSAWCMMHGEEGGNVIKYGPGGAKAAPLVHPRKHLELHSLKWEEQSGNCRIQIALARSDTVF